VRIENFHYLTRIHYFDRGDDIWGEHEIDYILFLQKDVDINPNLSEVSEIRWIKRENLQKEIESLDAPLTPWFDLILKYRLKLWWDNLNCLKKFEDHQTINKLN
jgi:isopentenyl-diphosphate delta-isomerase